MIAAYLISVVGCLIFFIWFGIRMNGKDSDGKAYLTLQDLAASTSISLLPLINLIFVIWMSYEEGPDIVIWRSK